MNLSVARQGFRASWLWTFNIIVAAVLALLGSILIPIVFDFFFLRDSTSQVRIALWCIWGINILVIYLAYFPGNLGVLWPYTVEIDPSHSVRLHGLFKTILIPISEIGDVEDSLFWQGYVVHLLRPRAALTQFIIPWYFGSQRKPLIEAVRQATD